EAPAATGIPVLVWQWKPSPQSSLLVHFGSHSLVTRLQNSPSPRSAFEAHCSAVGRPQRPNLPSQNSVSQICPSGQASSLLQSRKQMGCSAAGQAPEQECSGLSQSSASKQTWPQVPFTQISFSAQSSFVSQRVASSSPQPTSANEANAVTPKARTSQ